MPGPGRPFQKGHTYSRGPRNTFAKQMRRAFEGAVKAKDIKALAAVVVDKAKQGDLVACKMVFEYTLGKPATKVEISDDRPVFDVDAVRQQLADAAALDAGDADPAGVDVSQAPEDAAEDCAAANVESLR